MVTDIQSLTGLPVYAKDTGEKLEDVDDALFDGPSKHLLGLIVKEAGIISDPKVVPFSQIESIGEDAIWVKSKTAMQNAKKYLKSEGKQAKNENFLTKSKIIAEDGTQLGRVADIFFDTQSGDVSHFEIVQYDDQAGALVKKAIQVDSVVQVGKDATVVKDEVQQTLAQQAPLEKLPVPQEIANEAQQFITAEKPDEQKKILEKILKKQKQSQSNGQSPNKIMGQVFGKVSQVKDQAMQKVQETKEQLSQKP